MKKKNIIMFITLIVITMIIVPNKVMAKTQITEIRASGTKVLPGNTIPSSITFETVPAGGYSETNTDVVWYESDTGTEAFNELSKGMEVTGTFEEGKYYAFNTKHGLDLNSGYECSSDCKYYYNGVEYSSINTLSINWIKAEKPTINEVNTTNLVIPVIGNNIYQNEFPTVTTNPEVSISYDFEWRKANENFDKNHELTRDYIINNSTKLKFFDNNEFEEGIYIYSSLIETETDVTLGNNFKTTINGKNATYEFDGTHHIYQFYVFEIKQYTYKYISGDNQEFTKGMVNNYTYTIDGDYNKFESLKIGNESFTKDTDFIVTEGSTVITFTSYGISKLNKLSQGTYNVETKFTDNNVTGKLIINESSNDEIIEDNPKTGDGIKTSLIFGSISLLGIISYGLYFRKKTNKNRL